MWTTTTTDQKTSSWCDIIHTFCLTIFCQYVLQVIAILLNTWETTKILSISFHQRFYRAGFLLKKKISPNNLVFADQYFILVSPIYTRMRFLICIHNNILHFFILRLIIFQVQVLWEFFLNISWGSILPLENAYHELTREYYAVDMLYQ